MRKFIVLAAAVLLCREVFAQDLDEQLRYVERYKALAIWEMGRRGVPASIKLGQAILESRWGTTDLAVIANNHFGIKCGGRDVWFGPQYYKFDDEYDRRGQMQKSCFRQYNSPEESFIAHSEFLRNPLKEERYGFLFRLDPTDYRGWARGLRKAGYATDQNYHTKLIRIIETLKLWQYDQMSFREVATSGNGVQELQNMHARFETMVGELVPSYYTGSNRPVSSRQKLVPLAPIAVHVMTDLRNYFFSEKQKKNAPAAALLWTFREDYDHPAQVLSAYGRRSPYAGKSRYQGKPTWHTVRPNELMADISREYSIALSALYKRNQLEAGNEVAAGQLVKLRGGKVDNAPLLISYRLEASPVPKLMRSGQTYFRQDPLLRPSREEQGGYGSQEKLPLPAAGGVEPLPLPIIPKPGKSPSSSAPSGGGVSAYHIVQQGDTLYGISRKYGVSVGMLKSLNGLQSDSIVSGTVLRIR